MDEEIEQYSSLPFTNKALNALQMCSKTMEQTSIQFIESCFLTFKKIFKTYLFKVFIVSFLGLIYRVYTWVHKHVI